MSPAGGCPKRDRKADCRQANVFERTTAPRAPGSNLRHRDYAIVHDMYGRMDTNNFQRSKMPVSNVF